MKVVLTLLFLVGASCKHQQQSSETKDWEVSAEAWGLKYSEALALEPVGVPIDEIHKELAISVVRSYDLPAPKETVVGFCPVVYSGPSLHQTEAEAMTDSFNRLKDSLRQEQTPADARAIRGFYRAWLVAKKNRLVVYASDTPNLSNMYPILDSGIDGMRDAVARGLDVLRNEFNAPANDENDSSYNRQGIGVLAHLHLPGALTSSAIGELLSSRGGTGRSRAIDPSATGAPAPDSAPQESFSVADLEALMDPATVKKVPRNQLVATREALLKETRRRSSSISCAEYIAEKIKQVQMQLEPEAIDGVVRELIRLEQMHFKPKE